MENNLSLKTIKVEGREIVVTDSRDVAEMTGKEHKQLLKDVRKYIAVLAEGKISPGDFFIEDSYIDQNNQERPCYQLTKQGCEMVANKMTGKKGVLFTATYVKAFNDMQEKLKSGQANNFENQEDIIIYQMQEQKKIKKQLNEVNHRALEAKNKVEKLDKKVDDKFGELPLFTVDSKALSKLANSKMTAVLGGKKSPAYKKLNRKAWADLYGQVHREFGVPEIGAIKRKDLEKARQVIIDYVLPTHLKEQVEIANNQIEFEEAN